RLNDPIFIDEDLRMLREQVRRFVEREVIPNGVAWEREGKIPREMFRKLGDMGLLGMQHEEKYGGTKMGALASVVFGEELSRSSFGGFTAAVSVHTDMSASHITRVGTPEQKAKYLPELIAGKKVCAI